MTRSLYVLVVGEALIDVLRRADGTVAELPGGSPANVALTLGRLGTEVRLATWIGADRHGVAIRAWLAESGVQLVPGSDLAQRTSVAVAELDATGTATYDFDLTWQLPTAIVTDGAVAVHTGSIAAVLEPGGSAILDVVARTRETATVTYDPNLRPAVMGTPDAVRARVASYVALADVVKASIDDLAWLYPDEDPYAVARGWREAGPAVVVLTLGGAGAWAVSARSEVRVPAPQVTVVDSVGAGDSFMGALIHALGEGRMLGAAQRDRLREMDGATLGDLLRCSAAVAAITVSRPGADPPWSTEL